MAKNFALARRIQAEVADHFGRSTWDLIKQSRRRLDTEPRFAAMWLCRRHAGLSFPEIGRLFGRDHSTVVSAVRRAEALMSSPQFQQELGFIMDRVNGKRDVLRHAEISVDGLYRYELIRSWGGMDGPRVVWCMLNPSRADGTVDDPTIRKCIGFSIRWGYAAMKVINLFAYRSPEPAELLRCDDPVGPGNREYLDLSTEGFEVVVAWGAFVRSVPGAGDLVALLRAKATASTSKWWCLGRTRSGDPRHPSRLPYFTERVPWPGSSRGATWELARSSPF